MALLQLELRSDTNNFRIQSELEGVLYIFAFLYNFRTSLWKMDIFDSEESPVVLGIPILVGANLLGRFSDERLPPGNMFGLNIEDENVEAGETDFNKNFFLIYEEADD